MRRIFFTFIAAISLMDCSRYDNHVPEALDEIAKSKETTSLSEIVPYEWDRVYVIGLYESFDCSVIKGVPKKMKKRLKYQELTDKWFILLFTLNQKFVSYSEVERGTIDKLGLKGASIYTPEVVIPLGEEVDGEDYVLEKAKMVFYCIPDHKRVDETAKPYMSADLYKSLAAAWDIPDWTDGEMGNEEFLFYFITGNDPSDRQQIESATLVYAQQGRYIVDIRYREFWGSTVSQNLSSISLVLVNENGNILLDDFGQETKQQCKQYVREEVSDFLSGKTNQYMKDHQEGEWYTDSHIADVNESFKEYLSIYSEYIGRLGKEPD